VLVTTRGFCAICHHGVLPSNFTGSIILFRSISYGGAPGFLVVTFLRHRSSVPSTDFVVGAVIYHPTPTHRSSFFIGISAGRHLRKKFRRIKQICKEIKKKTDKEI